MRASLAPEVGNSYEKLTRRHQALHSAKSTINACQGCGKTFSRLDALNVSHRLLLLLSWRAMLKPGCLTRVLQSGTVSPLFVLVHHR